MRETIEPVVYIVDGDPAVRDSLTTLLGLNGYQVESFATGAAFLEQLDAVVHDGDSSTTAPSTAGPSTKKRADRDMECVVCEAELPDTTGIRIFQEVRKVAADTAFALLVSRRDPSLTAAASAAGITTVFSKPLVHRRLVEFIGPPPNRRQPS